MGLHTCSQNCINLQGSYKCTCNEGFIPSKDDEHECIDIDECKLEMNSCSHICLNTIGAYECTCPKNMILRKNKKTCRNEKTCIEDPSQCIGGSICRISPEYIGEYDCLCPDGFSFLDESKTKCIDIDECKVGLKDKSNPCPNSIKSCCTNTEGYYKCSEKKRKGLFTSREWFCESPSVDFIENKYF